MAEEKKLALFIDFENIAIGSREAKHKSFEIALVLERLVEKGKIMFKRAYADWGRYIEYKRPFHEAAIELVDIPQHRISGKNSADVRMVVDALDLCYTRAHIDTFVLVSGDSDFSPLVSKLRENNRYVIGVGVKNSSSELLVDNCDEFIYYEDLIRAAKKAVPAPHLPEKLGEAFGLLTRLEGIIPALESSHAVAAAIGLAREIGKDGSIIVNLSGRGDKDINTVADRMEVTLR